MRILTGLEKEQAQRFLLKVVEVARSSLCHHSWCGSIIVKEDEIIGTGHNSPPCNQNLRTCIKDSLDSNFKSDKTCCLHAEERAIMNALQKSPKKLLGSRIYFIRLDTQGNILKADKLKCTICSKLALDTGIAEFVLYKEEGICVYNTQEYNTLTFTTAAKDQAAAVQIQATLQELNTR